MERIFVFLWNSGFIAAEYGLPYANIWIFLQYRHLLLCIGLANWPGGLRVKRCALVGFLARGVWLTCVHMALEMKVPLGSVAL